MTISAKQVMALRAATGMPMMQCKQALEAEDGDHEKAVERLRKEGLKAADIRADRTTVHGRVRARVAEEGDRGFLLAVACETEPVANTPMFVEFVDQLTDHVLAARPVTVEDLLGQAWVHDESQTVDDVLRRLIGQIRENMQVAALETLVLEGPGCVGSYVHFDHKQGALVALSADRLGDDLRELARKTCMHIVFAKPTALRRADIPGETAERERKIYRAQIAEDPKMAKKPPQVIEKIVEGRLAAFYQQSVLEEQPWSGPESDDSVARVLGGGGAKVQAYSRVQIGG